MNTEQPTPPAVVLSTAQLDACSGPRKRVLSVEYESGWGWIARGPDGREVLPEFRWRTRSAARDVAAGARAIVATNAMYTAKPAGYSGD
jgi:hypothetical protein